MTATRMITAALLACGVGVSACGGPGESAPAPVSPQNRPAPPEHVVPQLPGGGTTLLPGRRLVGFSGAPGTTALGPLTGDLDQAAGRLREVSGSYRDDRRPLPAFELIATRATASPGPDGQYRIRSSDDAIGRYLDAARRSGAVLLLGIQPGRADFLDEVRHYDRWLSEPDVGLALDPEWSVGPGQVPGRTFGHTTGAELDQVAGHVAGIVRDHGLPQKPFVYHHLASRIVDDEQQLAPHPELAMVKSVDGIGTPAMKVDTWNRLMRTKPPHVAAGFKLFFEEDTRSGPLMDPAEVNRLQPSPDYVLYE
ncbi:hypothetical protein [Saccharopolyspora rosea]|uniref:Lipoprotein n=1 Tax=Saccharopolyspora rosea TaxID=524884 RepID=A0ABW3FUV6_9PSEU|nr:hypothetical protein [Saccharopolyspora rosea]